jgi:hypothetical protein
VVTIEENVGSLCPSPCLYQLDLAYSRRVDVLERLDLFIGVETEEKFWRCAKFERFVLCLGQ